MRKIILAVMLFMSSMNSFAKVSNTTRVMVISDPHVLTAANAEKLSSNKGGKLDKMSPEIFNKAVETIIKAKPEALLVCGDMTFNGEASGHTEAAAAFAAIESNGIPVLVIPGNHDILNPFSEDDEHKNVSPDQFKKLYSAFGMGDDSDLQNVSRDDKSMSWAGSLKGTNLGIIGLDANIYDETAEFYSDGCIRKSTIEWMKEQAALLRNKGKMVVCMVHQQLLEHVPGQSMLAKTTLLNVKHTQNPADDGMEDAVTLADLQKAFADAQIQYVLTGHFHIHHTQSKTVKNTEGEDFSITELTTGGLSTYPNWMRTLVFDTKNNKLENSTATMVQTKMGDNDLQTVSKTELTTWATDSYGSSIASVITLMNSSIDKYEIYDGTTQYQQEESAYSEVLYTRNFNNNEWQPLFVPFDVQYTDWCKNFEIAKLVSVNGDTLCFTLLKDGDALEKNTPALIGLKDNLPTGRYTISSSVKDADKTTVWPLEGQEFTLSDITLHGTYEGLTGDYLYQNNSTTLTAGQLERVGNDADGDTNTYLLPQRWFLTETSGDNNRVLTLWLGDASASPVIKVDGEELKACKLLKDGQVVIVKNNKVFNLKGQEVK